MVFLMPTMLIFVMIFSVLSKKYANNLNEKLIEKENKGEITFNEVNRILARNYILLVFGSMLFFALLYYSFYKVSEIWF